MSDELSYSLFLEQNDTATTFKYVLPRKIWIDDNIITNCSECKREFTMFFRKHHCRFCGKIFCHYCSNYFTIIPSELQSQESKKGTWNQYLTTYFDDKCHRVCKYCKDTLEMIQNVKKIIEVFSIVSLDLAILKKITRVCKLWRDAGNYLLSIFREIQYKLPGDSYTPLEKMILITNAKHLCGHNRYLVHLIKICDTDKDYDTIVNILKSPRKMNCWSMMCTAPKSFVTSGCCNKLTSFDAINLLCHGINKQSKYSQLLSLEYLNCNDREFKSYLPLLVYYLQYNTELLETFLINRCIDNYKLLNNLYWELQFNASLYSETLNKLRQILSNKHNEQKFIKLLHGTAFIKTIERISNDVFDNKDAVSSYNIRKVDFKTVSDIVSPVNTNIKIKSIINDGIRIKDSATKPVMIPMLTHDNKIVHMLHKQEDVRKDQIIMNIVNLVDIIVKKDEGIELNLVQYNVLPLPNNNGLIEIIDNSDTIYYIQETIKSSILNYILENNSSISVKELRDRFIKSTAAYCVITYLLGVGDRHLDNIMVTKDGRLFHIDFGYILGKDPVYNNTGIRITPEMIDAIGGLSSVYYNQFTDMCTKIYNCLRRNIDIFMNMLMILPKMTSGLNITDDEIRSQIIKRFVPGCDYVNAQLNLVNQLNKQSYTDKIKDWCHYHNKEKTISSAMSRFTNAMKVLNIK